MNNLTPELLQQITQTVLNTIQTNSYFCPRNSSILLWKSKNLPNGFTLKINDQRLVGLIRVDRKGENYWKFKDYQEERENLTSQKTLLEAKELSAVEKFHQRQEQATDHDGKPDNTIENSTNS